MYCPNCSAQNPDFANNCTSCGAPLKSGVTASADAPGKGLAIASLVCGIVSFFCFGIVLGILAVVFGGMATAGIVLGVIGLAVYVICLIAWGSLIPFSML